MRIESPHRVERFGAVRLHGVQEVYEFDSGGAEAVDVPGAGPDSIRHIPMSGISEIKQQMAIVIPVKGERLKVLEGVLAAIPHDCLIVVVSNSDRRPVDRYQAEVDTVERFCRRVQRGAVIIHQRGAGISAAFREAGMPQLIDTSGLIRSGKGEGLLVGTALAKLAGREFVGFIDADNFIPGAVFEYVQAFAASFYQATSPFSMVRISWHSKPTFEDGQLYFNRLGRASRLTNEFINLLISDYTGFGTELIVTGNSGEHALSTELAMRLSYAGGYAVEPNELINLLESYGGIQASPDSDVSRAGVDVYQVETRSPHLHEKGEDEHIRNMQLQALSVLYNSPICPPRVRKQVEAELQVGGQAELPEVPIYPRLDSIDWDIFSHVLTVRSQTLHQIERVVPTAIVLEKPIPELGDGDTTIELDAIRVEEQPAR
jgi:mannosyl-3-phosphoglycerate synthase